MTQSVNYNSFSVSRVFVEMVATRRKVDIAQVSTDIWQRGGGGGGGDRV